jgi:predicted RNase H-like HicB family nuclease
MVKLVVIGLTQEKREDGQYHVFSSMVPGFHVLGKNAAEAHQQGVEILTDTIKRRAAEIGREIQITEATEMKLVPDELRTFKDGSTMRTTHLVARIM